MVSIGPIHGNTPRLKKMEDLKKIYKRSFVEKYGNDLLKEFRRYIRSEEARISACYDDDYFKAGDSLESIILIDVVFIFELFLRCKNDEFDFLLGTEKLINIVDLDLQLLENQIPYFVLKDLYLRLEVSVVRDPFLSVALSYLYGSDDAHSERSLRNIQHFADLKRWALLKDFPPPPDGSYGMLKNIPCATKLEASGVEFTKCDDKEDNGSLIEIKYKHKAIPLKLLPIFKIQQLVLHIPSFEIDDFTESHIRNVMALEQLHYPKETHICSFVFLMDFLIDTEKDVDLLVEKGILSHLLGDSAAIADIFNRLGIQINVNRWCYSSIADKLQNHNDKRWNHAKATLRRVYFKDRWTGTATTAATVLLVLTLIQTLCSIFQVI